jgi:hypothetical protein
VADFFAVFPPTYLCQSAFIRGRFLRGLSAHLSVAILVDPWLQFDFNRPLLRVNQWRIPE